MDERIINAAESRAEQAVKACAGNRIRIQELADEAWRSMKGDLGGCSDAAFVVYQDALQRLS